MGNIKYKTIQMMKKSDKAEVCFAALDDFDKPVIVKRLFEANLEIYRVISEIHNPHLPQIYAMEESEGELLVVEEYIDGKPLDEYIAKESLSDGQILELMMQLCDALEVLHNCEPPVIHRDIKPSNILIDKDGVLKVIDFDASRQYKGEKNTSDTRLLGTIEYAAPEQFGYAQTDPRSDIYSLGVVLSEIQLSEKSSFAKAWKHIVDKCTSFDPENRYKDICYVKKDLQTCIRRIKYPASVTWVISGLTVFALIGALLVGSRFMQGDNEITTPTPIDKLTPEPTKEPTELPKVTLTNTPTPMVSPTPTLEPTRTGHYYQGPGKENDVLWYQKDMKPEEIRGYSVTVVNVQTEEQTLLAMKDMDWAENVLVIDSKCFAELTPGLYCLWLTMESDAGRVTDGLYLEVHSAVDEPDTDGEVFWEHEIVWKYPETTSVSYVFRPEAMCRIAEVYICEQVDTEDPYSEKLTGVYNVLFTLLEDNRGLRIGEAFWNVHGGKEKIALYIEFDDGRGEKVWITCIETVQE